MINLLKKSLLLVICAQIALPPQTFPLISAAWAIELPKSAANQKIPNTNPNGINQNQIDQKNAPLPTNDFSPEVKNDPNHPVHLLKGGADRLISMFTEILNRDDLKGLTEEQLKDVLLDQIHTALRIQAAEGDQESKDWLTADHVAKYFTPAEVPPPPFEDLSNITLTPPLKSGDDNLASGVYHFISGRPDATPSVTEVPLPPGADPVKIAHQEALTEYWKQVDKIVANYGDKPDAMARQLSNWHEFYARLQAISGYGHLWMGVPISRYVAGSAPAGYDPTKDIGIAKIISQKSGQPLEVASTPKPDPNHLDGGPNPLASNDPLQGSQGSDTLVSINPTPVSWEDVKVRLARMLEKLEDMIRNAKKKLPGLPGPSPSEEGGSILLIEEDSPAEVPPPPYEGPIRIPTKPNLPLSELLTPSEAASIKMHMAKFEEYSALLSKKEAAEAESKKILSILEAKGLEGDPLATFQREWLIYSDYQRLSNDQKDKVAKEIIWHNLTTLFHLATETLIPNKKDVAPPPPISDGSAFPGTPTTGTNIEPPPPVPTENNEDEEVAEEEDPMNQDSPTIEATTDENPVDFFKYAMNYAFKHMDTVVEEYQRLEDKGTFFKTLWEALGNADKRIQARKAADRAKLLEALGVPKLQDHEPTVDVNLENLIKEDPLKFINSTLELFNKKNSPKARLAAVADLKAMYAASKARLARMAVDDAIKKAPGKVKELKAAANAAEVSAKALAKAAAEADAEAEKSDARLHKKTMPKKPNPLTKPQENPEPILSKLGYPQVYRVERWDDFLGKWVTNYEQPYRIGPLETNTDIDTRMIALDMDKLSKGAPDFPTMQPGLDSAQRQELRDAYREEYMSWTQIDSLALETIQKLKNSGKPVTDNAFQIAYTAARKAREAEARRIAAIEEAQKEAARQAAIARSIRENPPAPKKATPANTKNKPTTAAKPTNSGNNNIPWIRPADPKPKPKPKPKVEPPVTSWYQPNKNPKGGPVGKQPTRPNSNPIGNCGGGTGQACA